MTIKEIMNYGCKGMSKRERESEQERRVKVAERINLLGERMNGFRAALRECEKGSAAAKKLNGKIKDCSRELQRIKGDEGAWLKEAAWFLYA